MLLRDVGDVDAVSVVVAVGVMEAVDDRDVATVGDREIEGSDGVSRWVCVTFKEAVIVTLSEYELDASRVVEAENVAEPLLAVADASNVTDGDELADLLRVMVSVSDVDAARNVSVLLEDALRDRDADFTFDMEDEGDPVAESV